MQELEKTDERIEEMINKYAIIDMLKKQAIRHQRQIILKDN